MTLAPPVSVLPESITELRTDLPAAFQRILGQCLAKETHSTRRRVNSARPCINCARKMQRGASGAVTSSTAARSSEEIINALAQIEDLRVAARTSAFSFRGKHTIIRGVLYLEHSGRVTRDESSAAGTYANTLPPSPDVGCQFS